jgi:hypothetical protein
MIKSSPGFFSERPVPALCEKQSNRTDYEQTQKYFLLTYTAMYITYVGSLKKFMRMRRTIESILTSELLKQVFL